MFTPYVSYSTWVGTFYGAIPKSETPGGLGKTTAHLIATGRIVDAVTLITRERFAPYPLITVFWVVSALWELAIYVFALRGWYLTRGQFPWWHISTCVILYFAVLSGLAGHFAISRLRMPIEPLLCLLAGYGTMK
ncbi:MAG TPA: hypothetical protein EYP10_15325 [Armatimonadetes bacterium]|nr:hypothetical protein [Armatimonadota bacterium]